jgi:hypothetical protein
LREKAEVGEEELAETARGGEGESERVGFDMGESESAQCIGNIAEGSGSASDEPG